MSGRYLALSDSSGWPVPEMDSADAVSVQWKLRYAPDSLTREDHMYAASVLSAYGYLLIEGTQRKRDLVAREVRAHLSEETDQ